jgi:hypothetical protein
MNEDMSRRFPIHPSHPERVCWGCARLCPAAHMACGNGKERTEHPYELFGEDWYEVPPLPDPQAPDVAEHPAREDPPPNETASPVPPR